MKKKCPKLICFLILISITIASGLHAQNIDTVLEISTIRQQYTKIINHQIDNLQITVVDNSPEPTPDELEDSPSASIENFFIYHNNTDTFLIRKYTMNDEGGAFWHAIEEVLFWNHNPFFYYKKTYSSPPQILEECRIYIANGKIIQKLTKESNVPWNEITGDFYDLQTDAPNQKCIISQRELNDVIYFIESSKEFINKQDNK